MGKNSQKQTKNQLNKYLRFTGVALQMGLTIYLGSLLGGWLDEKHASDTRLYTKICTLVAVFIAITSVIIQVITLTKKDD